MSRLLRLIKSSQSRLSRKIGFWLFSSILTIEFVLLIPSVLRREKEFLSQIAEVSAGKISVVMQLTEVDATGKNILVRVNKLQNKPVNLIGRLKHIIVGGALYKSDGQIIGTFGEPPELNFDAVINGKLSRREGDRFEATWTPIDMSRDYFLIFNHDISSVRGELIAFAIRISGLVLIISSFATVVVWIALDRIAIEPILALRKDLIQAGEAICSDRPAPYFHSVSIERTDELGDVINAFEKMFQQISTAIEHQKRAEAALKVSLDRVRTYSQALNNELEAGRMMQLNFLPHAAQIERLTDKYGWSIASFFKPARQVAGDFYDVFELNEGYLGIAIADVCDKGVGAALFMALFRSLIRIYTKQIQQQRIPTDTVLSQIKLDGTKNNSLVPHHPALKAISLTNDYIARYHGELGMFATIFFGVLEPATGLLTYINGGHEPLYVLNPSGGIEKTLNSTAPAVGMLPDLEFNSSHVYLEPGELLVGYTDGVPEARGEDGTFFTQKRLLSILNRPAPSATTLLDAIAKEVANHVRQAEQFDDITLLTLQNKHKNTTSNFFIPP